MSYMKRKLEKLREAAESVIQRDIDHNCDLCQETKLTNLCVSCRRYVCLECGIELYRMNKTPNIPIPRTIHVCNTCLDEYALEGHIPKQIRSES